MFIHKPSRYDSSISHLISIIQRPDFQRVIDDDHTHIIFQSIYNDYLIKGESFYYNEIQLGKLSHSNDIYIIDGQHRIAAAYLLYDKTGYDMSISVQIITANNISDLEDIYRRINTRKEVELYKSKDIAYIINGFKSFMLTEYKDYIAKKGKHRPHVPNIDLEKLCLAIEHSNLIRELNIETIDQLIYHFKNFNSYLLSLSISDFKSLGYDLSITVKKSNKQLAIGIYRSFEYIGFIINHVKHNIQYHSMDIKPFDNTKRISKLQRMDLWKNEIGDTLSGSCFVCKYPVSITTFEAGHIIPRAFGGSNELHNMKVLCRTCNNDCRCMNLMDYYNMVNSTL